MIEYIFGGTLASLLGFLFLYFSSGKKKEKITVSLDTKDECVTTSSTNGIGLQDQDNTTDVIIVGAGVAGAALAYTLGKDGRRVHVIERDLTEPDRIVGELLQPGGYLKLLELGLEDCVEEIDAQRVLGYALFKDGQHAKLAYPLDKFHSDVAGRSFHNGRFIHRMREKAATLSNVLLEQGNVISLLEENGTIKGVLYKNKTGENVKAYAPLTVVCDGCFSNLRRSLCSSKVEEISRFVGLILENCCLPFPNHGHVILGYPSPILFYPISSTEIRCLVDVPATKVPSIHSGEMANYLKTVVAPQVPPELYDSFIAAIDKGHIKTMPNRSMPAAPHPTPGALLMGDAFNMRHPLTGGGMTVALSDIVVLQNLLKPLRNLNDAPSLCRYLESFYTLRKGLKDNSSRALIGVKRMGELDSKPFQESCKRKYSADEADEKALVLCSQWEEYLKDPDWHPFKIIQVKEDVHQEIVNETNSLEHFYQFCLSAPYVGPLKTLLLGFHPKS